MPVTVKVGVTWRRDAQDAAHQGDLEALQSVGDSELILDLYSMVWTGAPTSNKYTLKQAKLEDIDVLVIPGGPHANQSQVSLTLTQDFPDPKNAPSSSAKGYADARATSELDLMERARYLGMPILAFCGGSWRLLQNYGGQTIEVGSLTMEGKIPATAQPKFNKGLSDRHNGNMANVASEFKHGVRVEPRSMLGGAINPPTPQVEGQTLMPSQRVPTGPLTLQANSVHWAVAREGSMGKLPKETSAPYQGIDPGGLLQVNARDSGPANTVEGFEGRTGAPVLGTQWHPEYLLPTDNPPRGETAQQTTSRQVNYQAIRYILEAGAAYRARCNAVKAIREQLGFTGAESKANVHFPETSKGSGVRVASGPQQVPSTITAESVTKYLKGLKRNPPFLKWPEWKNLMNGRPLSQPSEPGEQPDYAALAQYLNKFSGPAKFITGDDLQKAKATLPKNTGGK
ncbi:MAG TPA: gamma-glutamyl-gamma-aminobutyrate hydrolase family protein [Verrucomicrobiae bacterium]|nr:gamma-glutamyl-gamma-aminobutyrate hydrolase family protein [Verrucomicrobiae bacterium]